MKKFIAAAALSAISSATFASPCVALDYQEMKDMSVEELALEACKASASAVSSFEKNMENLGRRGPKPYPDAQADFDQCMGQSARMERVLAAKGVPKEKIPAVCEQARATAVRPANQ
ncbi:hypothetical protein ACFOHT_10000 [Massilia oculi]|uniref:Secreted protein n=1 Tax=Massilia oculi TaxID=945844 RepID=A0A2S2DFW7_9BURK|nr:hypothetical protein [Massilia oculi]AWL04255.1 hypothetical protein DIR46_07290 [Massilia oculi]